LLKPLNKFEVLIDRSLSLSLFDIIVYIEIGNDGGQYVVDPFVLVLIFVQSGLVVVHLLFITFLFLRNIGARGSLLGFEIFLSLYKRGIGWSLVLVVKRGF
jgi:hypothetical protein